MSTRKRRKSRLIIKPVVTQSHVVIKVKFETTMKIRAWMAKGILLLYSKVSPFKTVIMFEDNLIGESNEKAIV